MRADIGLIGLAVMGKNLVLNMQDTGFTVAVFNRSYDKTEAFIDSLKPEQNILGYKTVEEFCANLTKPRRIMLMVKAGSAVDATIASLLPHLEAGDVVIDGGNSYYPDSSRRYAYLKEKQLHFIGAGVSGGEEGARFGPSIMPGGDEAAWPLVKPIFQAIAAKVDDRPCCDWIGPEGAGHFVKMVHNGIEYGDMQLICEAYDIMRRGLNMDADSIAKVFADWNKGPLDSYLIEITADIFTVKDQDGTPLLEKIVDKAGQKGTGRWTAVNALDAGMPLTLITEAVFARALSAQKAEREETAALLGGELASQNIQAQKEVLIQALHDALYAAKIISYTQGFMLMAEVAKEKGWPLDMAKIALLWRGGCIIRSVFLNDIAKAFEKNNSLTHLLLDDFFKTQISQCQKGWRSSLILAIEKGIPTPAMSSALAFYDGLRSERLPANLLQAQRDYFGAHQYERVDKPIGEFFHTDWAGLNGQATSGSYNE